MKIRIMLLSMMFFFWTLPVFGGWIITSQTSDGQQIMYIQTNMIRLVDKEADTIFDVNNNKLHFVIHDTQKVWSGTPQEFSSNQNKAMDHMSEMMEAQLAQIPADQREAMRGMMMNQMPGKKNTPPAQIKVNKASQTAKIAGYNCQKYEILANDKLKEEMWIASSLNLKKDLDIDKFLAMTKHMSQGLEPGSALNSTEVQNLFKKGWAMKNVHYDETGPMTEEVVKVEQKSLPADSFNLPKGYQPITLDEMFQMGPGN